MKRSEMIVHIQAELEGMVESIKLRPNAAKYAPERYANGLLDMIEGFGMLPPLTKLKDPGHFPGDEFTYEMNQWEPEGEG